MILDIKLICSTTNHRKPLFALVFMYIDSCVNTESTTTSPKRGLVLNLDSVSEWNGQIYRDGSAIAGVCTGPGTPA